MKAAQGQAATLPLFTLGVCRGDRESDMVPPSGGPGVRPNPGRI